MVILSDVLIFRFVDVAALAFQAVERMSWTANLNALASALRLGGLAAVIVLGHPTVVSWSIAYSATGALAAIVALICATRKLGRPRFRGWTSNFELRDGFYFSAGLSAQTIYNDIDKTMLARLSTLNATGVYAAAYRIIEVIFVPVRSVLTATYPEFFRVGRKSIRSGLEFARNAMFWPLLYSIAVCAAVLACAPAVLYVLGPKFADSVEALRLLAVLPVLRTLHCFGSDALTGADHQGARTTIQVSVAAANILANLWFIPAFAWRGAAWTSVGSDGLLALAIWTYAWWSASRELRTRGVDGLTKQNCPVTTLS